MRSQVVLGRVLGVEIGLHSSWLVLAALLVSSLAGHFSATAPEWGPRLVWATAAATALLVFVSLVVHELAHAAVARSRGIPVPAITLFALGGVAQIQKEAGDPRTEFLMGLAGPATSALLGVAALTAARAFPASPVPRPAAELLAWLGAVNGALAVFNLIPGFPLDGGRLLRAALWGWTGDFLRATRAASRAGQAVACALLALGGLRVFAGAGLGGLWLALLGWFLLQASTAAFVQAQTRRLLEGVRVADLMERDVGRVGRDVLLELFVTELLLKEGRACYVVAEGGEPVGLITAREAACFARRRWVATRVGDAMRPLAGLPSARPETPAAEALDLMAREDLLHLPVFGDAGLEGILSRAQLALAVSTRRLL